MIPRETLDEATTPDGGRLRLVRRGDEYSILLGSEELMNSRRTGSEAALATEACRRLAGRPAPVLLIGGLGLGFTLRAALDALGGDARILVAELVPAVVKWARGPLAPLFGSSLDDPRVRVFEGDVADLIAGHPRAYDAILLDVDNGPDGLTVETNDRLYDRNGLDDARRALRPGGLLAIWSARPDPAFTQRLRKHGFGVEEIVSGSGGARRGTRHLIWIATAGRGERASLGR